MVLSIGTDLGGTNIKAFVLDRDGHCHFCPDNGRFVIAESDLRRIEGSHA